MEGVGEDAGLAAACAATCFGRVPGGHEHQHAAPAFLLPAGGAAAACAAPDRPRSRAAGYPAQIALSASHVDAHRLVQQSFGQRLDGRREGGGEQQVLPRWRQQRQHAAAVRRQSPGPAGGRPRPAPGCSTCARLQRVVVHQVQQAARGGDHHVGTAAQAHHLRIDGNAAEYHGHLDGRGKMLAQCARSCRRPAPPVRAWAPAPGCAPGAAACAAARANCCSRGSAKAAVLPEPVWARASRSCPRRMAGMACSWMGVGAA